MKIIDGITYKKMLTNGLAMLANDENRINALNVFPVPDGDTGTNMRLTLESGVANMVDDTNLSNVSSKLARGMLLGARGNSGVILSQLFKGQSIRFKGLESANVREFAESLEQSYKTAYNAVIHPAEGTILTVAREGIHHIMSSLNDEIEFEQFFEMLLAQMDMALANTPNLLKVLKDANVIDSGGAGLVLIYKGMLKYLKNEIVVRQDQEIIKASDPSKANKKAFDENSKFEFGYCTEFLLQLQNKKLEKNKFDIDEFIKYLETKGNSIVAFKENTIVKVHVHTFTPGDVLNEAQKYGEFINLKIENMQLEHNETVSNNKNICTIAVVDGKGIAEEFKTFGCDVIIEANDNFNTSTEEFIMAIKANPAKEYIIFPNNKNIIMAAKQAKEILNNEHIHIIETKSVIECYFGLQMTALDDEELTIDEHIENIMEGIEGVDTLLITRAIRKSVVDGISINGGDYIAILNGKIIKSSLKRDALILEALDSIKDIEDKAIISIFSGNNISVEEANTLSENIKNKYEFVETGVIDGKQMIYDFIIGIN